MSASDIPPHSPDDPCVFPLAAVNPPLREALEAGRREGRRVAFGTDASGRAYVAWRVNHASSPVEYVLFYEWGSALDPVTAMEPLQREPEVTEWRFSPPGH